MLPVIAIVGRPNVGKSTLFNYLTKSKSALVADIPGVTRDRRYGKVTIGSQRILIVDTGGLADSSESAIAVLAETQVNQAIEESNCVLFLVDAEVSLTSIDEIIANRLRKKNKRIFLVINKVDRTETETTRSEFCRLGFSELYLISAKKGYGIKQLMTNILGKLMLEKKNCGKRS